MVADFGSIRRPFEFYVLQRDDNIRGVRPRAVAFSEALNPAYDSDDVYRFWLREGETLRANLSGVSSFNYIDMWMFRPSGRDVVTGGGVMVEDNDRFEYDPLRFRRKVPATGTYYLDTYGAGAYRMAWSIEWPGRVASLAASPTTFTPNGNGIRDRTKLSWRVRTPGRIELAISDSRGRVRRTVNYGWEPKGPRALWWSGRNNDGRLLPGGVYTATVTWRDGKGRFSRAATKVTLQR